MARFRHALLIRRAAILGSLIPGILSGAVLSGAAPALAQGPGGPGAGRSLAATGQTKPPGAAAAPSSPGAPVPRSVNEAAMVKAQKAAEARSKAWDAKMRRTMSSICHGC